MPDWPLYAAVLFAAIAHAAWNVLVKQSDDQLLTLAGLRMVGLPVAVVLLMVFPWPAKAAIPYLIGNVCFMYAYYYFLLNSYRVGEFSSVYPIARGFAPAAVLATTYFLDVDTLTTSEILSTVAIGVGVVLFASQRHLNAPAVGYALATGVTIAGYTLLAGIGVRHSESTLGYLAWSELLTAFGLIPFAVFLRAGRVKPYVLANWRQILVAGFLSMSAFGIVLFVFNFLPLGPVTAVRESSIAFAALFGIVVLKERMSLQKAVALFLVVVGTITLSLGS